MIQEREENMVNDFGVVVAAAELESRLFLGEILMKLGLKPLCVPSLRDCYESIVRKNIGLIFCGTRLTDGTYTDLLSAYRRREKKPRIVVTAPSADWDGFKEAMRWGAFDVISSPCRPTDVEWMVIQAKRDERNRRKFQTGTIFPVHSNETVKARSEGMRTITVPASCEATPARIQLVPSSR